jgi:hypothetical protein
VSAPGALIDRFLPEYDVVERHRVFVRADAARAFAAVRDTDISKSWIVAGLLLARGLRPRAMTLQTLGDSAFTVLGEEADAQIVLGRVGRFWEPSTPRRAVAAADFAAFDEPGWGKAAWDFRAQPRGGGVLLTTETRVRCTDASSRLKFRAYWLLIRPFSGLIRRRALALIKRAAERAA